MAIASRVLPFVVSVPANTPKASPTTTPTRLPIAQVVSVEIDIPAGHAGLTGIYLAVSGAPALPWGAGNYFSGNGSTFSYELVGLPDSGDWSAVCYNTDTFAHAFTIRYAILDFAFTDQPPVPPPAATPLVV